MRNNCNKNCNKRPRKNNGGCNNQKPIHEKNCNCIKPLNHYEKCEKLAQQSRELYDEALCYNKKIEKYNTMAAQAECKAKKLEEEARIAWCDYNEFVMKANEAAEKGERLMKASCNLLQESQECYSNTNAFNGNEINNQVECDEDYGCGCGYHHGCNCGCGR